MLIRFISDPDRELQFAAIAALGQIGGPQARRVLELCCDSEDDVVQLVAEDALAELQLWEQPLDILDEDDLMEDEQDDETGPEL